MLLSEAGPSILIQSYGISFICPLRIPSHLVSSIAAAQVQPYLSRTDGSHFRIKRKQDSSSKHWIRCWLLKGNGRGWGITASYSTLSVTSTMSISRCFHHALLFTRLVMLDLSQEQSPAGIRSGASTYVPATAVLLAWVSSCRYWK